MHNGSLCVTLLWDASGVALRWIRAEQTNQRFSPCSNQQQPGAQTVHWFELVQRAAHTEDSVWSDELNLVPLRFLFPLSDEPFPPQQTGSWRYLVTRFLLVRHTEHETSGKQIRLKTGRKLPEDQEAADPKMDPRKHTVAQWKQLNEPRHTLWLWNTHRLRLSTTWEHRGRGNKIRSTAPFDSFNAIDPSRLRGATANQSAETLSFYRFVAPGPLMQTIRNSGVNLTLIEDLKAVKIKLCFHRLELKR